ncbi:hypothetical protein PYK79_14370 [Streptomyces sp. ID05-04B]|nr:hypothetical protein [Streptomyces sp. ID05-04B]
MDESGERPGGEEQSGGAGAQSEQQRGAGDRLGGGWLFAMGSER